MDNKRKVFDINDYENVKELYFSDFEYDVQYCFSVPYFAQRLKEQSTIKNDYVHLKGNLVAGKLKNVNGGDLCEFDIPRSVYDKLRRCANRNTDSIKSNDIVKFHFIRYSRKAWTVLQLEVTQ